MLESTKGPATGKSVHTYIGEYAMYPGRPVKAVQFFEKEYRENRTLYPHVCDRADLSELWVNLDASHGRYYLINYTNPQFTYSQPHIHIKDGDYIILEGDVVHVMPKELFEFHFRENTHLITS